ncbi:hypothetical protein ACLVWU_14050 [Bdellovibrio sp. HCB290]|uniref:hypothetical protein n=1 Tax=Bdellovibrio sp. HCB290 TaxID=3394356 RepID=UPI0039B36F05
MKLFALTMTAIFAMTNLAFAKTVNVHGDSARSIMEALGAANFPVSGLDDAEWSGNILTVEATEIYCRYSSIDSPDNLMFNVNCYNNNTPLQNPLALAKAIAPFADFEGAAGSRYLTVDSIKCGLKYSDRAYACQLEVQGLGQE